MNLSPTAVPDLRDGYVDVLRSVLRDGRRREARGYGSTDVRGASFTVEDTTRVVPYGVGRAGLNDRIAYAEALLLCAGVASSSLLASVAPAFRRFMDGGSLNSYGPLVRSQMEAVVGALRGDPDTRQATVRVNRGLHEHAGSRDVPCTLSLGFELEGRERLHLLATMRSNDAWLGLSYDAFVFCQLGWTVANVLGVELATYTHQAYSLHVYDRDLERVEALHPYDGLDAPERVEPTGFSADRDGPYEVARRRAEAVYDGSWGALSPSELMYVDRLREYDRLTRTANFSS